MKLLLLLLLMERVAAQQRGLFPAILNLASNAVISSNATCGDPEPEVYCKLVEHVPGRRIKNPHCPKCDANSVLSKERHPITNAIDGTNQWWQSPSIKNGQQFHWVTITLDLKQIFQVAYVIIKAANSPRPGNWILERSLDGVTFDPWQYYALSDTECLSRYNVTPRLGPPTYKRDTEVICTSYYSKLNPLEHGEIHTSLINGRPGADDLTSDLLNFTSARYIRLRLQRIRTLNADLMTLSTRDPRDIDPIVTRRYYYSIKDISVGGMCICYGHAQSCPLDPVSKKLQCVCEHNTCGESCNECCPGYHQQPWQPGTISEGNTCEKCNCHNKAVDCFYNQTVSDLSLSLNTRGVRRGGGVCIECQQHTAGINCETCADGYYRPAEVSPYSDSPCSECNCDLRGSESSVCSRDDTHTGQCVCKEGFAGRQCDRCAFGYRDFPHCVRCECNLSGSTNSDPCSPCICKVNVMGAHCDLCKPGYYNLQESNPLGCTDCFCFGVSDVCESSAWSTAQIHHADALLRLTHSPNTHSVVHGNELPVLRNVSSGHAHQQVLSWEAPKSFLGNKLVSYGGFLNFTLVYDIPLDNEDHSLPAHCDVIIEGNGQRVHLLPRVLAFLSPLAEQSVAVAVVPNGFAEVQTGRRITRDDLLSILADVSALRVEVRLNASADGPVHLRHLSLDVADPVSISGGQAVAVEMCECPWGYSGTSCEACLPGFYRVGGVLFGGNCLQCECNDHATECDSDGVCLGCTHNTTGPHCDQCLPGFYGDPTEGTAGDCQVCPCPLKEPSNSFSPTCMLEPSGQVSCDQCQEGYTGRNCERCASGFYGNPQVLGGTCVRCECNGNVDIREAGHCDTVTGECLRCLGNTFGRHCEVCQPGYYGDAVHAKNCQECSCDVSGAFSSVCDVTTGQCLCKENVTGRTCDRCQFGFFGLQSGRGCQACGCNQSGSLSESCDEQGRCHCAEGVAGDKCDRCSRGFYGYSANGCKACNCDLTGGNCDPESGKCICPAHTEGDTCDRCETGYWGHDLTTGCKPCSCSSGSFAPQCDLANGQCPCKEGFSGRSCDQCAPGYYGYPECLACGCDIAGTDEKFCNTTLGVCDCGHTGQCVCKAGVSGRHCEECVSGWFALSADGCSPCFCSGLSSDCEETGGLFRAPITLAPSPPLLPLVSQSNLRGVVSGVFLSGGEMLLDTRHLNTSGLAGPLYWRLPRQFEGEQMMSYGGILSYVITFYAEDGAGLSNQEPQVMMRGGTLRKLVIYTDMVAPDNGIKTKHDIRMTEHKWKYFNSVSDKSVTRSDFLSVINNLEYIAIKASYGTTLLQSRISNITMETALGAESLGDPESDVGVARHIESCICPLGYAGLSCQDCAAGFFHQPAAELSSQSLKSLFVRPCVPCRCNNHSGSCDPETGDCQDCQHNTTGRGCELCAPGYYGNVSGSISDCSLCACPRQDNSFSPTCVAEGAFGDFRCTACQEGYEGRYCERCSVGYYGNPSLPGGVCSRCTCSGWGSLQPLCDTLTGQCDCKAGVKGQSCDQCEERHVLEAGECVSCDDECSGVLLDDLEKVHNYFLSVNLSSVAMAPYSQLVMLENRTREFKVALSPNTSVTLRLSRVEDELSHVTSDLSALMQQVTDLTNNLEKVSTSTTNSISQSAQLLESISNLQDNIQVLQREAETLNQTTVEELDSANQTRFLEEVESMLDIVRAVNLTDANITANQELSLSESLLHSLQQDIVSYRAGLDDRLRPLSASLSDGGETLQFVHKQLSEAATRNKETHTLLNNAHTLLHTHQSLHQNLSAECVSADGVMEDAQLLLEDTISITQELTNTTTQVEEFSGQLDQWRPLLRKQVDGLVVGLKKTDALENVYRAESHAHQLQSHSQSLHSLLSSVWNVSQNGSRLVQLDSDIRQRVNSAQQVALIAHNAASAALNMSVQSEQLLSEEGGAKLNISSAVLEESRRLNRTAEELRLNVSMVTNRLGLVRESLRNSSLLLRQPITELLGLSNDSAAMLEQSQLQAAAVRSDLQEALQRLNALRQQLQVSSSVVENTNVTVRETNQLVTDSHSAANEAQRKLEEAGHRTERLMDRIKPLSMLGENLSRNLSDIRELINQARKQAASIKVAVQADRDCVRSYRPQIESTNFNTLSLTLKTDSPDNLLFYLGSNSTADFMAVEMHDGKVSLLWDLGSGGTRLEFPGLDISNNRWTRINATRFGTKTSLSVYQLESEAAPLPAVTATSPGPSQVLDINENSVIHIGGRSTHTQTPPLLRSSTFQGCVGEAFLNERNIGLWNYVSREGSCGGCFSSPQMEETSFHFDGSGFSVVQKSLRATSTSIVLLFKTLSPGGLLLYLSSNNTRDFLSIELVEGRVRLTFDLGSGALILTSNKKYNTGVWYKITLQRSKRKGYLSIMAADQSSEKEVLEAESPGTASDLNRSDLDPIYIGGLPASRPIRRQVVSRSYMGCIKNVEIARSNFDLLRDAYGVRKGCVLEAVRSVSLLTGGFVQIAPRSFSQEAELLFSFSSKNQSGVLLAALSDTHKQHFLSVHLVSGALEAELGDVGGASRKVMLVKPDGTSFSDGKKHSVIITINKKSLSMQVDEEQTKSVSLSPGGFSRLSQSSLFIGGIPLGEESRLPIRLQEVSRLFRGCIQHLVVGGVLVDLSEAVKYEGAELDSCLLEEKVRGAVLPDDTEIEPTPDPTYIPSAPPTHLSAFTPGVLTCVSEVEPTFLPSAAQFGLSKHSHMTFRINPSTVKRSVSLRLSLRSRALDGLIALLSDAKQNDFIVLRLAGGRLIMSADLGKGPASITSSVAVNDGAWHTVSAELARRTLSVSVDGSSPDSAQVKGNLLDVEDRLYLGGLPHTHTSRRINVSSSFSGCLRSASLNGAVLDLSKPTSKHDVTSCFSNDQTGSYFNGSGYATLMRDGYKVGSDLSVSLEFRTSQSEGVFFGISSAKVDAIGLEMVNGQVAFNVNNGAGRVSVRSIGHMLCDGRWHRLLARKTKHTLTLSVDGRSYTTANPYPQSTSAETNNPIYLGGYPEGVKQNCLSINSRFRGCLRNLQIIKSHLSGALTLSSAHFLLGVTPNSCPAA
ncbi:laminin subunit alpha-1 isoform X3 [Xyrichtys novacula]|uniref:Laminin subunit alpha-1 n=1 Tax=Xyrichtys novacula TaxID=13765 RepID=A0AAV1H6X9_XYRNO|nr:laminin subunit alpha-1 isoform X3 [Xyrichtys novacula]